MPMTGVRSALPFVLTLLVLLMGSDASARERNKPGEFDYYVLVLSWSPSYCRTEGRHRKDGQCDTAKPRAFVLHGLWPQYHQGWPENCRTEKRPWVPQPVIDGMRDIMPSKSLIIHQYRDHGTCSGLEPAQYFGVARELYERVNVPARFVTPDTALAVSPDEIEGAFAEVNSWLRPEMISVSCRGPNLLDIRICFGRDLFPQACGVNEDQRRLCRARKIAVPSTAGR